MTFWTPMYPSLVRCYFPKVWMVLECFWVEKVHGKFLGFSWMFFIVLDIFAKNKKVCVLIQSFDLFHKVYVLCIFKCLNVLDICLNGVRDIGGCVRINFLSHTPLAPLDCFMSKLQINTHITPFPSPKRALPQVGVLLGLLCNYIKFWYFCVFALWPKSLRFYV